MAAVPDGVTIVSAAHNPETGTSVFQLSDGKIVKFNKGLHVSYYTYFIILFFLIPSDLPSSPYTTKPLHHYMVSCMFLILPEFSRFCDYRIYFNIITWLTRIWSSPAAFSFVREIAGNFYFLLFPEF